MASLWSLGTRAAVLNQNRPRSTSFLELAFSDKGKKLLVDLAVGSLYDIKVDLAFLATRMTAFRLVFFVNVQRNE